MPGECLSECTCSWLLWYVTQALNLFRVSGMVYIVYIENEVSTPPATEYCSSFSPDENNFGFGPLHYRYRQSPVPVLSARRSRFRKSVRGTGSYCSHRETYRHDTAFRNLDEAYRRVRFRYRVSSPGYKSDVRDRCVLRYASTYGTLALSRTPPHRPRELKKEKRFPFDRTCARRQSPSPICVCLEGRPSGGIGDWMRHTLAQPLRGCYGETKP